LLADGSRLDEATRRDLLRSINDEAGRLNRLIRNLLNMTRLESGAVRVNKELYPLEEIIEAVLTRLGDQFGPGGRRLAIVIPSDLPLIPLDSILIEQVFTNLLENALRYTPAASPIEVSAQAEGNEVRVEVTDRGPGLPKGDEKRIFDKFYHAGTMGNRGGVGLGLAICRGIVEAHGGQIWAENREGGGAVFRFTLPLDRGTTLVREREIATHA
jgi:two-component system sensor histidine kinase KdpD